MELSLSLGGGGPPFWGLPHFGIPFLGWSQMGGGPKLGPFPTLGIKSPLFWGGVSLNWGILGGGSVLFNGTNPKGFWGLFPILRASHNLPTSFQSPNLGVSPIWGGEGR